ncbi:MAG: hypothetical protein HY831_01905 [Candidatus Aenigmarchaeota archaeon]|nr:hypothetical protein [Candidatus Aenigmarchaeota archaeon]
MHSAIKLIVGLLIFLAGLYWYLADVIGQNMAASWLGHSAITALKTVFIGVFGLVLIFIGALVIWIEYEDLKWEMQDKKSSHKKE